MEWQISLLCYFCGCCKIRKRFWVLFIQYCSILLICLLHTCPYRTRGLTWEHNHISFSRACQYSKAKLFTNIEHLKILINWCFITMVLYSDLSIKFAMTTFMYLTSFRLQWLTSFSIHCSLSGVYKATALQLDTTQQTLG